MRRRLAALFIAASSVLPSIAEAQSPAEIDRLAVLGHVWGFLKYNHPGVAVGTIDWDSALVASVPRVRAARTDAQYHEVIQALIDAPGAAPTCEEAVQRITVRTGVDAFKERPGRLSPDSVARRCRRVFPDSARINVDDRWLTHSRVLSPEIVRRLTFVRDNHHQGSGRYVKFGINGQFAADTAFSQPEFPPEPQRLLALFRFWNAARYYFPYMYVNDGDWSHVLAEFVPRMIAAETPADYLFAVVELSTRLNDAHVGATSPRFFNTLGFRGPAFQTRTIEGKIVVWKLGVGMAADGEGVLEGDVITHIDGRLVEERRRALAKYVAGGNPAVIERKLVDLVMLGRSDTAAYTVERNGRTLVRRVLYRPMQTTALQRMTPVAQLAKVLPNTNIGYINMGDIYPEQVDSAIAIVRNTAGIVMDVRNYPRGTMYQFAEFFNPTPRAFVNFAAADSMHPGYLTWSTFRRAGRENGNPNAYRGRVAILVDERTQSHAEFSVMALQTAPENKVIGSQTAGADGNVTVFTLPGGIRTVFTGLAVFYPDGRKTQRIGIVPDIAVRPTLAGFRAGRDEVLERALDYIRTGR